MSFKYLVVYAIIAAATGVLWAQVPQPKQPVRSESAESQARVDRQTAARTASGVVPGGRIKSGELEREHGLLIWSFDIAAPGSHKITEVHVDAVTGRVVRTEIETPADQAREAAAEKRGATKAR